MIGGEVGGSQRAPVAPQDLDAVTIDAYGTLVELHDPVGSLLRALPGFSRDAVEHAFRVESAHYVERSHIGRDAASLARLRDECATVFNRALGSSLTGEQFVAALQFRFVGGAIEAIERLRARGLALAVASNWDISLVERLRSLGLPVATSAEAGAPKPDTAVFRLALERLGVRPERALHVGDSSADEEGAHAAGLRFAPAPLAELDSGWA